MKKKCGMCGKTKALSEYHPRYDRMTVAGLGSVKSRCKKCSVLVSSQWQKDNPDAAAAHAKKYRKRKAAGEVKSYG
jgi:hypothetical protein